MGFERIIRSAGPKPIVVQRDSIAMSSTTYNHTTKRIDFIEEVCVQLGPYIPSLGRSCDWRELQFRVALDFDTSVAAAAMELIEDASRYREIAEIHPEMCEALTREAEAIGIQLDKVLPRLRMLFTDGLAYPSSSNSEARSVKLIVLQHAQRTNSSLSLLHHCRRIEEF